MGASSAEIDQEIRDTRNELDHKLAVLERRATSGARKYGRYAAVAAVGILAVGIGAVIYRRRRDRAVVKQLHRVVFETIRDLPQEVTSRLKESLPIKVVVSDKAHSESTPNPWTGLAHTIVSTIVGSAAGAVVARMRGAPPEATSTE